MGLTDKIRKEFKIFRQEFEGKSLMAFQWKDENGDVWDSMPLPDSKVLVCGDKYEADAMSRFYQSILKEKARQKLKGNT